MRKGNESGLTLLEVLVAVFILGIVLTAVYGAYTSNVEAIQIARVSSQVNQAARIVLDRMSKDLEAALIVVPFEVTGVRLGVVGEDGEKEGKPSDRISFTSTSHLPIGDKGLRTDLCEIGYDLEEDEEGFGLVLYRRDDPTPDDDITEGGSRYELARNIAGLDIRYEDSEGGIFEDWNTFEEVPTKELPSLISIELIIIDPREEEHRFVTSIHPALAQRAKEE